MFKFRSQYSSIVRRLAALALSLALCSLNGCLLIPDVSHQPVVHNPFPQISRVAVAPFRNLSADASADGRQFAQAYFAELQLVPGYVVVPVGVVEGVIAQYKLDLSQPEEVRKLATILEVDAVAIGAITDFSPYYPPRCGMQVEWYAANPCFHPIPPGYGLPWGTPEEEFIPAPLVQEAEMALARAQLETQTPPYAKPLIPQPEPDLTPALLPPPGADGTADGELMSHAEAAAAGASAATVMAGKGPSAAKLTMGELPANWPTAQAFVPKPPCANPAQCAPTNEPVMRHTRLYNGADASFTEALASYYHFQDDARFGGWQSYLQRSDDFIRFCCHLHLHEMLTARGGAGESRVVWRWPKSR